MKKSNVFIVCALLLGISVQAQNTTTEEYNYIKAGIVAQAKTGQDVQKRGYRLVPLAEKIIKDSYSFSFAMLTRDDQTVAGYWVYAISHSFGNEYALCIPLDSPNLKGLYESDVKKWDAPMARAYANALSDLFTAVVGTFTETITEMSKKDQ